MKSESPISAFVSITTIIVVGLFLTVAQAFSQTPCVGICDPQQWMPGQYQLSIATDCQVTLAYEWRTCGTTTELRVVGVVIAGPCTGFADPISIAISIMVRSNQMLFPTGAGQPEDSEFIWIIRRPACWQKDQALNMVPCSNECCVSVLTVKNKANCDSWRIVTESSTIPSRSCQVATGYLDGNGVNPCSQSCNEIFTPR